jgi:hypothetical protein
MLSLIWRTLLDRARRAWAKRAITGRRLPRRRRTARTRRMRGNDWSIKSHGPGYPGAAEGERIFN